MREESGKRNLGAWLGLAGEKFNVLLHRLIIILIISVNEDQTLGLDRLIEPGKAG